MLGQKPSEKIATIAGGFINFVWPQWGVGAHTALPMNAFVGLLLIWPLPYMVSRTFRFIIFICKVNMIRYFGANSVYTVAARI